MKNKVCTQCGARAWMFTSVKHYPDSPQAGEYRCWKWMMSGICRY
jgi:hypothetical protein